MTTFALKDIKANPFRNIARYPIRRDKIEALRESIKKTGFWDNIVARNTGTNVEIAYGHHRLTALQEVYGSHHTIELIIRDLSNETMIQIMAQENMQEWGTNVSVEHETVRVVVVAYGNGKIKLPAPKGKTKDECIRYAPSFKVGSSPSVGDHPYTDQTLAEFLGWLQPDGKAQEKVRDALGALEFIEMGLLKESIFEGLSKMQAREVILQTRKELKYRELKAEEQRREAERMKQQPKIPEREQKEIRESATRVAQILSKGFKNGDFGYKQGREEVTKIRYANMPEKKKPTPDIYAFEQKLAKDINDILNDGDSLLERLNELLKYKDDLNDVVKADLVNTLNAAGKRCFDYAQHFDTTHKEGPVVDGKRIVITPRLN